ncbi:MAG TPA: MFS transporter [Patescibacteria group bacterium]|jgi:MFS family permease|nr:MFS transporter [Patescibacteria group bacterium]
MPEALHSDVPDEVSAEELAHPSSLAVHRVPVPPEEGGLWSPGRRPLTVGLVLTITLVATEALAVSTAMPIVARELGGLELYGLVFSAFTASSLVGIVVAGQLIDRRGIVLPFVLGLAMFAAGLTIAGAAISMPMLILGRLIQGLGGGAIPPIAYVAIGRSLPEHLRPSMFATLSTAWILPGVFGPGVAGVVAEAFNWRLIFFGLLPVLLVSGAMAYRGLSTLQPAAAVAKTTGSPASRVRNGVLMGIGVILATTGLQADSPVLILGVGVPGLGLAGWAFHRLVPPGTLRAARGYPTAVLLRGFVTFAFFAVDAYVALLLVEVRGWSAAQAGIALTAATLSWTAGSWTQARLSARFPHEWFVRVGFPVVAAGIAGLGLILLPAVPAWLSVPIFAFGGFGMGLTYAQFALIVLRDVPRPSQGEVTSGLTLSDSLGTALGLTVAGAFVAAGVRAGAGPAPGLAAAIVAGTVVAVLGWFLSPRLRPAAAAAPSPAGAGTAKAGARLR